jgi:hypothetical protein
MTQVGTKHSPQTINDAGGRVQMIYKITLNPVVQNILS